MQAVCAGSTCRQYVAVCGRQYAGSMQAVSSSSVLSANTSVLKPSLPASLWNDGTQVCQFDICCTLVSGVSTLGSKAESCPFGDDVLLGQEYQFPA